MFKKCLKEYMKICRRNVKLVFSRFRKCPKLFQVVKSGKKTFKRL